MTRISRRKLARHAAGRLAAGDALPSVLNELAAYLVETRRTRELELIVRDIELALLDYGTAVATLVSARTLSAEAKKTLVDFVKQQYDGVSSVLTKEQTDESLIGGVRLELPGKRLDNSVKTKLEKLTV